MATTKSCLLTELTLDLKNYRTVPQTDENHAVHAMISVSPDYFWALMESLLEDGYLETENILVLKDGDQLVVKEGNRRVGALKLIHGHVSHTNIQIPEHLAKKITALGQAWKDANAKVPCLIFPTSQAATVDRIITLTHGKAQKAGRDIWSSVARARHNRDKNGASEIGLDLLESYLKQGRNLTAQQAERWSGDFKVTVLDEALKKIAPRLGYKSARELADAYPKAHRDVLEKLMLDIGLEAVDFPLIRGGSDWALARYNIPETNPAAASNATAASSASAAQAAGTGGAQTTASTASAAANATAATTTSATSSTRKPNASGTNDPASVRKLLRSFVPKGKNREKLVTLAEEARTLKLSTHPLSFCFLVRSMLELSAKAYCTDHQGKAGAPEFVDRKSGKDRGLHDVLTDVFNHLTNNRKDVAMTRVLQGAHVELGKTNSIMSVDSLNQLIHNPKYVVNENDICVAFSRIFPFLQAMNR